MTLRPYQQTALADARQAYRDGARRVLMVAPCGAGKTVCAASAIASASAKGRSILVVAPRREIVAQTSAKLTAAGVRHGIIAAGQRNPWPNAGVQLGMAQTVRKRLQTPGAVPTPTLVVVDEAHLDEWAPIAEAFPLAHYLLLTATPLRSSGRSWHGLADALVEVETVAGLVAAGHLVEPVVYSAQSPDLAGIRRGAGGELSATQAGARYQASAIMGDTVQQVLTRCAGLRVLVFASSVAHSQALDDAMRAAGLRSAHIDGTTHPALRDSILADLAAGHLHVVTNYGCLCEGLDVPTVGAVVVARATQSESLWRQMVGRGLRPASGKDHCVIIDQGGNAYRHGHPLAPRIWTLDGIDRAPPDEDAPPSCRTCAECQAIYPATDATCPRCGSVQVVTPRKPPKVLTRAELALLRPDGTAAPTAVGPDGKRTAPRPLPAGVGAAWRAAWEQLELQRIEAGRHWRWSLHALHRAGAPVEIPSAFGGFHAARR
jgi:DNA repair protein RadD